MSFEELVEHLNKFETNGEEIFKVRHLIQQHFEALLNMESDSPLTPKTIMHLLAHCDVSIAFVDGVTNDIIVRLFIRLDKRRN